MFTKKEKATVQGKAVLRCSICTGEQTAGFLDEQTGAFHESMLIRNQKDLKAFCRKYGVKEEEIEKIY